VAKLESIVVETERVEERPTVINDGNERERGKKVYEAAQLIAAVDCFVFLPL